MIYPFMCQLCNILEEDFCCLEQQCEKYEKNNGNTFYFVTKNSCICTTSASCLIQEITALRDEGEAKRKCMHFLALKEVILRNEKKQEIRQTVTELQKKWEDVCQLATEYSR